MQRVVDLAKLAILPKTIEMAIQLAKHAQLNSLASQLEFVKLVTRSSVLSQFILLCRRNSKANLMPSPRIIAQKTAQ